MPFPINPNKKVFERPANLQPGFGITVEDDGHIYGYLALFNARLIGSGRKNTRPPRSKSGYSYANSYNTKCDDGTIVRTGVIAGDGGHRYRKGFEATQEAYADVSTKIARVVYGEDEHGVWFSGALCPDVDDATVEDVRSSGISGHWERPAPHEPLELLGSCLVNIPGFAQAADHRLVASATFTPSGGVVLAPAVEGQERDANKSIEENHLLAAGNRITAAASRLVPVSGVLAALGSKTVDGRQVNNVEWNRLPMPLWYLDNQGSWGHAGAVIVGRIDAVRVEGSLVMFDGVLEEGLEGSASAQAVADLDVLGISMDGKPVDGSEIIIEYDEYGWPEFVTFDQYEIHGATLTSMPAFHETLGVQAGGAGTQEPEEDNEEQPGEAPVGDDTDEEEDSVAAAAGPGYTTIKLPVVWH